MINIPYPDEAVLEDFYDEHKEKILNRIKDIKLKKSVSIKKKKYRISPYIKKVLTFLEDENILKELLLSKPDHIVKIIEYFEKHYKKARYKKEYLNKILYRIFVDYGYDQIDNLNFINKIGIKTCPYCNRNYTFTVNKAGSIKPEIDHFYPKSLYPYLACSYFNLIPSCPTCNGFGAKEAKDTFYVYPASNPYTIKPIDFQFSIAPQNINFINVEREQYNFDDFEIELYGNEASLDIFKLESLYKQHKDIVLELLVKKAYYPQCYIDELYDFGFSKDEIYRYLFSNYSQDDELHKRPLSKLIKDIVYELNFEIEGNIIENQ